VLSTVARDRSSLQTVICDHCGLVWTDPRPVEDIEEFYRKDYRLQYKGVLEPKRKHVYRACMLAKQRLQKIRAFLKPHSLVLDIGAGGGEFVYVLNRHGYHVHGIEPNQGYAAYAIQEYGLDITVGLVQKLDLPAQTYDLITMWHVLEHLEDPFGTLSRLYEWLRPQGRLIIEVPNVEALCVSPPNRFHLAHLYNFNRPTLECMGQKAGFSVEATTVSADTGNILTVFQKNKTVHTAPSSPCWSIEGNCRRIMDILQHHTTLKHYGTRYPYQRLLGKMVRHLREQLAVRRYTRGRDILDAYGKSS
jgi:SAM-dependent methyltransferase